MSKVHRKPTKPLATQRIDRHPGHLKKPEVDKLNLLRGKLVAARGQDRPDVQSTVELMYPRILSRVKDRQGMQADLKQLESLLNQAATKMTKIMDEADKQKRSK